MNTDILYEIKNKLSDKITVYVNTDTYDSLHKDCKDFEVSNMNDFINRLIGNYIEDYYALIDELSKEIKDSLEKYVDEDNLDSICRSIAFKKGSAVGSKGKTERKINFRLQKKTFNKAVENIYAASESLDLSSFFRNMFLSYLSLPIYKREQIIYRRMIRQIEGIIKKKEKLSYCKKDDGKTHIINPYTIDSSSHELFNYLVGQYENGDKHKTSVRIARIKDIVPIHKTAEFSDNFEQCYKTAKKNGIQFMMDEVEIRSVTLNEKQYQTYNKRYLERPKLIDEKVVNNFHVCYFDCSKFQLESFFTPFLDEGKKPKIDLAQLL